MDFTQKSVVMDYITYKYGLIFLFLKHMPIFATLFQDTVL